MAANAEVLRLRYKSIWSALASRVAPGVRTLTGEKVRDGEGPLLAREGRVRSGDYFAAGFGKMTRIVVPLVDHAFRFQPQIVARDAN